MSSVASVPASATMRAKGDPAGNVKNVTTGHVGDKARVWAAGGNKAGMKCPACSRELHSVTAGAIVVDACQDGCGGTWFDNFELRKVDEAHEVDGHVIMAIPADPAVSVEPGKRYACPRCEGIVMLRHFFSPKRTVEVDRCPGCNGIWLGAGELAAIRGEYPSEVERQHAIDDFVADSLNKQKT
jgi:Zn-finger nucleic acid-binding protein